VEFVSTQFGFLTNDPSQTVSVINPVAKFGNYPFVAQLKDNIAQSVSLNLNIPIYNNRQARLGLVSAEITKKNAEINLKINEQTLRNNVERAVVDLKVAKARLQSSTEQKEAAALSYSLIERRFERGASNFVDYNNAINNTIRAKAEYIQALYDYILKEKIVEFYRDNAFTFE
jgi:outer membrane protein